MNNELTSSACRLCDRVFGKRQMTNHLKACWKQRAVAAPGKASRRWFHLIVEARYAPDYWLHLQAPANCTFGQLDSVLRRLWLECCDHLSAFKLRVKQPPHQRAALGDQSAMLELLFQEYQRKFSGDDECSDTLMGESLGSKLQRGVVFSHEYDFGTTTELKLRVGGEYTAPVLKGGFKVLARNEPPRILCSVCKKPATQLCQQCSDEGLELCDACARRHDCDPEMLVPLINSPRTGLCGYCGPSVEP